MSSSRAISGGIGNSGISVELLVYRTWKKIEEKKFENIFLNQMFQLLRYTKLIKYWHLHMKARESTAVYSHISFGHIRHTSKKVLSILIRVHLISIGIGY